MLRSAALELATSFRLAVEMVVQTDDVPMHIQGFPRGCCGIISELMGDYFNTLGVGEFFYVCGVKEGASHAWLEVDTGISHCRFGASSPRFSPSSSLRLTEKTRVGS